MKITPKFVDFVRRNEIGRPEKTRRDEISRPKLGQKFMVALQTAIIWQ